MRIHVVFSVLLVFLFTCALTCSAEEFSRWHQVSPSPEGNYLRSVAFGNGLFVAVGEGGTIISSTDGKVWTVRKHKGTGFIRRVCAGNNVFIAVGDNGDVLKSADTKNWEKVASISHATGEPLESIIFGDKFMAVNEQGKILSSQDGETWQEANTPSKANFSDIAYTGEGYIAVGDKIIASSTNGIDWETTSIELNINHVAYGNGKYIISTDGGIYTSTNSNNWDRTVKIKIKDPFFGNDRYLNIIDLKFVGNCFVAISEDKIGLSSSDGMNWQQFDLPDYHAVTFGKGIFVSVGSGVISTSEDAIHWINTVDSNLHKIMSGVFANKIFFTFWQGLSTSFPSGNVKLCNC